MRNLIYTASNVKAATDSGPSSHSCGLKQRIIQIHPTLRCNLLCTHCYSNSGPAAKISLEPSMVCKTLSDAAEMGYCVASFSGGEPLLYEGLFQVLAHAKACGMHTTITTNGTLLSEEWLSRLQGFVDLLAISLDGPPDLHNGGTKLAPSL